MAGMSDQSFMCIIQALCLASLARL